jgi:hypothetical protein
MASVVDAATNALVATLQINASLAGYRQLLRWSARFAERRWAVENARGLGRHLAQWLAARGEAVTHVPSTATARVRELSRGGRRKNDVIDAAAAASVAALHGDASPVVAEDASTVLALLDKRRDNVVTQRTRLGNQLHALLRDLLPGGADTDLTAVAASRLLTGVRRPSWRSASVSPVWATRKGTCGGSTSASRTSRPLSWRRDRRHQSVPFGQNSCAAPQCLGRSAGRSGLQSPGSQPTTGGCRTPG